MDGDANVSAQVAPGKHVELDTLPDPVLRVIPTDNHFRQWLSFAGGEAHSVCPPDGRLSARWLAWKASLARERGVDETRAIAAARAALGGGKAPAIVAGDGWRGCAVIPCKQEPEPYSPGNLRRYERSVVWHAGNVGVQAARTPGLDVDVLEPGIAKLALAALTQAMRDDLGFMGQVWRREGRAPKFLVPLRMKEGAFGFTKAWVSLRAPDGGMHKVELLGTGQQWVASGVHGGTGLPYAWWCEDRPQDAAGMMDGLPPCRRSALCEVTADEALRLLEAVVAALVHDGACEVTSRGGGGVGAAAGGLARPLREVDKEGLRGSEAIVRMVLGAIPNGWDVDRDRWVRVAHAVKGACGGEAWGLEAFHDWSRQWPGGWVPENDVETWGGIVDTRIGAKALVRVAQEAGWPGDRAEAALAALSHWRATVVFGGQRKLPE